MNPPDLRPSRLAANLGLSAAVVAALGLFLAPYATFGRDNFSGAGTFFLFPGRVLDFAGFLQTAPAPGLETTLGWVTLVALVLLAVAALQRSRLMWAAGLLAAVIGIVAIVSLESRLAGELARLPELGLRPGALRGFRNFYTQGAANLGMFLPVVAGVIGLLAGLSAMPTWYHRLNRLRGVLVPLVAIGLAIVVGALVVLLIQKVPGTVPVAPLAGWYGKLDLVWFVYTTLFAPLTNLGDLFQSLTLATPLIFTGLSVAFAFRAGLFNIGAPGQIVMGGVFAMLVGVYVPLPGPLLLPLTVIAAGAGGALWGAIPGFLKARFGASEVINTIMLNYIGSAIFIFLIGSSSFPLFGRTYNLPFKAEGFEAKSQELQEGARLASLPTLLGFQSGERGFLPLAPLLALAVFVALFYYFLARHPRRVLISLGASLVVLVATWTWLGVPIEATGNVSASRLNLAFVIALLSVVFFAVFMWRTSTGYALRAVGFAPKAAEYGGINVARSTVLAMTIAGAFAGLSATHYVMGGALDEYRLKQNLPTQVGFDGITVALMGQSTPIGVVASSVLFGTLDTGGLYVDQKLDAINKDIVTVLKALIVLFVAAGGFLSKRITDPPPPILTPNLGKSSAENREALGHKPDHTAGRAGEGASETKAANPLNDGTEA